MKVWQRILFGVILGTLALGLATARLARADIPQPDTAPTVISVAVYRNLLETGDRLFRIYARIPYATMPTSGNQTILVNEAYLWRLLDSGGGILGYNSSFPYHTNGYGYNVCSLYFDNASGITWSGNYSLQLTGIPPGYEALPPPTWNFAVPLASWSLSSAQADEQAELAADVINLSGKLDGLWGNTVTESLLFQSEIGAVLSQQGMYYWNNTIPSLQSMAPTAYQVIVGNINTDPGTWTDNYTVELGSQWASDNSTAWLADAQQGGADFFNLNWDLLSVILVLGVGLALAIGNIALTGDAWNALIDVSFWMIIAARLGLYGLAFLGLICALCLIYIALKLWGLR